MRRISVILITVACTLAVTAGAAFVAFGVRRDNNDEGLLLLYSKQAKECADGGGCVIFSVREMATVLQAAAAHGYAAGMERQQRGGL